MAVAETCGLKTTSETKEVYVALGDDGYFDANNTGKWVTEGKYIIGIYTTLGDLKRGMRWHKGIKYCEKCKLTIEKLEDINI